MERQEQDRGCRCLGPHRSLRLKRWIQRRLRSTQPIPSPGVILTIYIVVGCSFLLIGVVLHFTYQAVVELRHDYTDEIEDSNGVVSFEITVDRDMERPIWNHRLYVASRDDMQLMQTEYAAVAMVDDLKDCHPKIETDGRGIDYPCGLVASTVFNDTFHVAYNTPESANTFQRLEVDSRATSIAWAGDVNRFVNLDPEALNGNEGLQNQHALNMWLLRYFPPVKCEQVRLGPNDPLVPVQVATRIDNADGSPREVPDCTGYTGRTTCNFKREGASFNCTGNYQNVLVEDWGVTSGHFLVWMRTAALPTFRKPWGKVDQDIKAGTRLKVYVESNFPVKDSYGRKAFVMSTASVVGGKNAFLGIAYVVVGAACLIFAPIFFINSSAHGPRSSRVVQPE